MVLLNMIYGAVSPLWANFQGAPHLDLLLFVSESNKFRLPRSRLRHLRCVIGRHRIFITQPNGSIGRIISTLVCWQCVQPASIWSPNCAILCVFCMSSSRGVVNLLQICIIYISPRIRGHWKRSYTLSTWQRRSIQFYYYMIWDISCSVSRWQRTVFYLQYSSQCAEQ